ncbi:MAG: hypothetical protein Q9207_003936 [Kuettlingeria erythrocarpa]
MTHLFCFAVLAVIAADPSATLTLRDSPSSLDSTHEDNRVTAQQYFTPKKAPKTLDLVIFRVISVYGQSSMLTLTEVIESLRLSTRIVEAVDISDRVLWIENNKNKLRKLSGKVLSSNHKTEALCEVLNYISTLNGEYPLPQDLLPVCKTLLCRPLALSFAPGTGVKLLNKLMLDESSIQEQLIALLQAANRGDVSIDTEVDVDSALVIVESFSTGIECSAPLRQKLLCSLSTNALAEHLSQFLHLSEDLERLRDDHRYICYHAHAHQQIKLQRKICTLFLKAALYSQQDALSLDTSVASTLLDKQAKQPPNISTCQKYFKASYSRKAGHVVLFESGSTPDSHADSSSHWRERVKIDLQQNAEHQFQTIVRTMGNTCQDLERRCDEVERPLREAQGKSRQLQESVDASKLRIAELEEHNQEQKDFLDGIEQEKSELNEHVKSLETVREDLLSQVDALRQALDEAIQEAENGAQSSINRIKELELVHAAALAERDEILETQHRHEQEVENKAERLEASAVGMRAEAVLTANKVEQLQATASDLHIALGQANFALGEKQAECEKRDNMLEHLQEERKGLQSQVSCHDPLCIPTLLMSGDQVQNVSNTCRTLREDLAGRNSAVESQLVELNNLRCTLETERAAQNIQLVQLADDVECRDNELREARELTDQVMEFWRKPRPRDAPKGKRRLSVPAATQSELVDNVSPLREPEVTSRSVRASPTPKRSKTYQGSPRDRKIQPRVSIVAGTPATRMKPTPLRRPLRSIDTASSTGFNVSPARISPCKLATTHQKNQTGENDHLDMTGVSICDSDFFASNDQRLLAGVDGEVPQGTFDETTTEF